MPRTKGSKNRSQQISTFEELTDAIQGFETSDGKVTISNEKIIHSIPKELLEKVNQHYNGKDLNSIVGDVIYSKYPDKEYRNQRCIEIYGKLI